jgi:hypothetical protein
MKSSFHPTLHLFPSKIKCCIDRLRPPNLVAASEAAAAKADARQDKLLKLLAEEVANEPPPRKS